MNKSSGSSETLIFPDRLDKSEQTRAVVIEKVENGFIINIGCKVFVATDWRAVALSLEEYWDDPIKAQEKYCKQ